jgi:SAM-dependent methyltransferase
VSNEEQKEFWDGEGGEKWARDDAIMADMLRPASLALLDHAGVDNCRSALDVGCGGGSQSLLLAERLGAGASVLGVDISGPMLDVARSKLETPGTNRAAVQFLQADASEYAFEANSFDLLFSRFGVMFFDDPVAAFTNIRQSMREDGRLAFCCWQAVKENPWVYLTVQAALEHFPAPEPQEPDAPGPFAFADPQRLTTILQTAGFDKITLHPFNSEFVFSQGDSLAESVRDLAGIGPVASLLKDQGDEIHEKVYASLEQVLAPYYQNGKLALPVAIWFVTGQVG